MNQPSADIVAICPAAYGPLDETERGKIAHVMELTIFRLFPVICCGKEKALPLCSLAAAVAEIALIEALFLHGLFPSDLACSVYFDLALPRSMPPLSQGKCLEALLEQRVKRERDRERAF